MDQRPSFTAGPWLAEGPDMFGDFNILHPKDSLAVAAVVSNLRPAHVTHANARLVAIAPELYEALKGLVDAIRVGIEASDKGDKAEDIAADQSLDAMQIADAVLAKAEGR